MDFGKILAGLAQTISSQAAEVEEKIQRLETAKQNIEEEKKISMQEIKLVLQPELGDGWKGERSIEFEQDRHEAYEEIKTIIMTDYEDYISDIRLKITALDLQRAALSAASGLANEAGELLDKGESAAEALSSKIDHIKRSLV
ncbi:DUF5082 domain-containing protein [Priestia megaterium]|nr:DUF5082 domain-containing protein [Priestia megaterium]